MNPRGNYIYRDCGSEGNIQGRIVQKDDLKLLINAIIGCFHQM